MKELNFNVNVQNLTEEEKRTFLALIEKAYTTKYTVWKPKYGESYWYIIGAIIMCTDWSDHAIDIYRFNMNNCFRTKQEAKEEIKRIGIVNKFKKLSIESGEENNPWDAHALHYFICYNYISNELVFAWRRTIKENSIYFATEEALKNAIKEIGEDNVKKYILNVEEAE